MFLERVLSLGRPTLDWIQVEVSSHCNAACTYCPRTVYRDRWEDRHLPLASFERLIPAFSKTGLVYLQGWGEPFLNPGFFAMAAMAKEAGCRVGTTTNGMLLTPELIQKVVEAELDILAFSLAGTDERNDAIRKGTRLDSVLKAMSSVTEAKERRGSPRPEIHIAYMLLRSGLHDLDRLPDLLKGLGVAHVVISTLDYVPSSDLQAEALSPATREEFDGRRSRLDAVADQARRHGIGVHYRLGLRGQRRLLCTENVQRALCVSARGTVTPCVYTNLPRARGGTETQGMGIREDLTFGDINREALMEIWQKDEYKAFRRSFQTGNLAQPCSICPKLSLIHEA
ncbi:MAG: radical SAM/SPASM domain-containing protein [Thermodesulfobacteriota bacterium]